jgi:hypothetical protein
MKTLLVVAALLLVGIAGLGFYLGWFGLSTGGSDEKPTATVTVDTDKIHADEETAKEKLQDVGQAVKEKTNDLTESVRQ